jgi:hypothetical protein
MFDLGSDASLQAFNLIEYRRLSTYLSRYFMRIALVLPAAGAPD